MNSIKCENCGANLEYQDGEITTQCVYCGAKQFITYPQTESSNVQSLLIRASVFLRDQNWEQADEYCNKALDILPTSSMAYFYKFLAKHHSMGWDDLIVLDSMLDRDKDYLQSLQFGDESFRRRAQQFIKDCQSERIYVAAVQEADKLGRKADKYKRALLLLEKTPDYKDARQLIKQYQK